MYSAKQVVLCHGGLCEQVALTAGSATALWCGGQAQ